MVVNAIEIQLLMDQTVAQQDMILRNHQKSLLKINLCMNYWL